MRGGLPAAFPNPLVVACTGIEPCPLTMVFERLHETDRYLLSDG